MVPRPALAERRPCRSYRRAQEESRSQELPTSSLDQDESPALALLHIASQFVIDSGVDVRWDGATSAPAAEALRLLRFASKFRRHAPVDRTAHLMFMARAADELDSDAVWITHGLLLRHFIQRTIT